MEPSEQLYRTASRRRVLYLPALIVFCLFIYVCAPVYHEATTVTGWSVTKDDGAGSPGQVVVRVAFGRLRLFVQADD